MLLARFFVPFEISDMIGPIVHMFPLLLSMDAHNVFHVYMLEKYVQS